MNSVHMMQHDTLSVFQNCTGRWGSTFVQELTRFHVARSSPQTHRSKSRMNIKIHTEVKPVLYTLTDLDPHTTYYVRITTINKVGQSDHWSEEISVTTRQAGKEVNTAT